MPLPLAPLLLRLTFAAAAGYVAGRFTHRLKAGLPQPRRDQRLEDAFDDLEEGLAFTPLSAPAEGDDARARQAGGSVRLRRGIGFRGRHWDIDAGVIARLRLKERRS